MNEVTRADLHEQLKTFAVRAKAIAGYCDNEEQTKVSLVNPFLELLGYDVRDPRHVRLEEKAGIQDGREKVDYAVLRGGEPWMVVEAKKATSGLGASAPTKQIVFYAMAMDVRYVALTNGREWRWFRKQGGGSPRLEKEPFLVHDVTDPTMRETRWLAGIHQGRWNEEEVARIADEESLQCGFSSWFERSRRDPPEALLKLILNDLGHRATGNMLERAGAAWKATLKAGDDARLAAAAKRLQGESVSPAPPPPADPAPEPEARKRRHKYRYRKGPREPWRYKENGSKAIAGIARELLEGRDDAEIAAIGGEWGKILRRDDEVGQAPRWDPIEGVSGWRVFSSLTREDQMRRMACVHEICPGFEIETDGGLSREGTPREEWPWEPVGEMG